MTMYSNDLSSGKFLRQSRGTHWDSGETKSTKLSDQISIIMFSLGDAQLSYAMAVGHIH